MVWRIRKCQGIKQKSKKKEKREKSGNFREENKCDPDSSSVTVMIDVFVLF